MLVYASSEGHFDRTLQVNGSVTLDVSTGSGDITVKTGGSNQVVVHGTVHSSNWIFGDSNAVQKTESNPPIQQSGNSIRIGYDLPDDVKRHVPSTTKLRSLLIRACRGTADRETSTSMEFALP